MGLSSFTIYIFVSVLCCLSSISKDKFRIIWNSSNSIKKLTLHTKVIFTRNIQIHKLNFEIKLATER